MTRDYALDDSGRRRPRQRRRRCDAFAQEGVLSILRRRPCATRRSMAALIYGDETAVHQVSLALDKLRRSGLVRRVGNGQWVAK